MHDKLTELYGEPIFLKVTKAGRIRWAGHVVRQPDKNVVEFAFTFVAADMLKTLQVDAHPRKKGDPFPSPVEKYYPFGVDSTLCIVAHQVLLSQMTFPSSGN